ncbi:hypothetical protein [Pilimelia columellifera]|uniref:Endonuclease/exonuclease/phosphatase family protein n=1 Tax=Pilimelia columellifera subsp. columellifera TaxID=706583 RepID=A0ABN3NH73_9ACTN
MPSPGLTRALAGASRSSRNIARTSAVLLAVVSASLGAGAASAAPADAAVTVATPITAVAGPLRPDAATPRVEDASALQVNLCGSGYDKDCYEKGGASVKGTVRLIKKLKPQVLTLNEVCRNDLDTLFDEMRAANPGSGSTWSFSPIHGANGAQINCVTGGAYGTAVVATLAGMTSYNSWTYTFSKQARGDERRLANCSVIRGRQDAGYFVCSVQFSHEDADVAAAQCGQLTGKIMGELAGETPYPIMSAGTFNLDGTGVADCIDPVADEYDYTSGDDMQWLVGSEGVTLGGAQTFEVKGTGIPATLFDITFDTRR